MYRRSGPPKATPSTVKCQKCLKNDKSSLHSSFPFAKLTSDSRHYSYQCTASAQERPYVPRPSRSQQLANPKLVPKLTEAAPPELQKKEGVADQQLAKLEAERARKRELERGDDSEEDREPRRRRRSASFDSVSTISTTRSVSPRPRASPSPAPVHQQARRSSYHSISEHGSQGSASPPRRSRGGGRSQRSASRNLQSLSRSPSPVRQRPYRSRSPDYQRGAATNRDTQGNQSRRGATPPRADRERSMSPFSRRLALTRSMNSGR